MKSIHTRGMLVSLMLAVAMPAVATTHDGKSILVEPAQRPLNLQGTVIKATPQAIVRQVNEPVRIRLENLLADEQAMVRPKAAAPGVPTQVGLHRAVAALASVSAMNSKLQWQPQNDGRLLARHQHSVAQRTRNAFGRAGAKLACRSQAAFLQLTPESDY